MSHAIYKPLAAACASSYEWNPWKGTEDDLREFTKGTVAYYFVRSGTQMSLVFRGTDDTIDWFYNARISTCFTRGVHAGFWSLFKSVWRDISDFLNEHYCPYECYDLQIGGHSQGGALALLAVRELYRKGKPTWVKRAATFGCPAIFDRLRGPYELQQPWGRNIIRFVNGSDVVPHLLNWRLNMHVGKLARIGPQGWHRWPWMGVHDHTASLYAQNIL